MKTTNYLLGYKDKYIVQDDDMFKFSLDSVLLANFVSINPTTKNILDIGCGNGPIPLILSTKTKANITGIEIQKDVALMAQESVDINKLNDQITIINDDINNYDSDIKYDIITCNPPYFKVSECSNLNESDYKTIARHEVKLSIEQLIKVGRKLLKTNGTLAIVHRPDRFIEIITLLKSNNFEPKKIQFVYPKKGSESNIMLIEATLNGKDGVKVLEPLCVYENGKYTKEIEKYFEG